MSQTKTDSKVVSHEPGRVRRMSRFGDIAEQAAREASDGVILAARREGRTLVVEVDGEVRDVPATELLTSEERAAAAAEAVSVD